MAALSYPGKTRSGMESKLETGDLLYITGVAAAKAKDVKFGRPGKWILDDFGKIVTKGEQKKLPFAEM